MKVHKFTEIPTEYKEVRHYQRTHGVHSENVKEFVNISLQRHFNKSQNVSFWYKTAHKENGKRGAWSKPITGLFRTKYEGVYYGDIQKNGHKTQLLFFVFDEYFKRLVIVEYPSYPKDLHGTIAYLSSAFFQLRNDTDFF